MCVPTSVCHWAHCTRPVLLEKVPAMGVVGNWGFSLQAWLCVMADIPRGEQGSGPCLSLAMPVLLQGVERKVAVLVPSYDALWRDGCSSAERPPESRGAWPAQQRHQVPQPGL